jgi:hypothetical protein
VKSRLTRFGDASVLRESVVTGKRRIALGMISALRVSLSTVLRQHGTFWARRSMGLGDAGPHLLLDLARSVSW